MQIRSRKAIFVAAITLGLMAAAATAYQMNHIVEASVPTDRVVVARTAIPSRTEITGDMIEVREVPRSARHPEAIGNPGLLVGKTTRQQIDADEQILPSKIFQSRQESGLSFAVPPGMRAVAIGTDERIGAGGLIAAGDRVDVMGICNVAPDKAGIAGGVNKAVFTLEYIEVLAVAQKVAGEEGVSALDALKARASGTPSTVPTPRPAAQAPTAKTLTLSLTPSQAQAVVLVEQNSACSLRLALRNKKDDAVVALPEQVFNPVLPLPSTVQ